jgi:hypothetical protein
MIGYDKGWLKIFLKLLIVKRHDEQLIETLWLARFSRDRVDTFPGDP